MHKPTHLILAAICGCSIFVTETCPAQTIRQPSRATVQRNQPSGSASAGANTGAEANTGGVASGTATSDQKGAATTDQTGTGRNISLFPTTNIGLRTNSLQMTTNVTGDATGIPLTNIVFGLTTNVISGFGTNVVAGFTTNIIFVTTNAVTGLVTNIIGGGAAGSGTLPTNVPSFIPDNSANRSPNLPPLAPSNRSPGTPPLL